MTGREAFEVYAGAYLKVTQQVFLWSNLTSVQQSAWNAFASAITYNSSVIAHNHRIALDAKTRLVEAKTRKINQLSIELKQLTAQLKQVRQIGQREPLGYDQIMATHNESFHAIIADGETKARINEMFCNAEDATREQISMRLINRRWRS